MSNQVVLITGGGGGVGAHLARNFGKLQSKVIIWDVNSEGNDKKNEITIHEDIKIDWYCYFRFAYMLLYT